MSLIARLIAACRAGLAVSSSRRRMASIEPASNSLRFLVGEIVALSHRERQQAVMLGARDQRRKAGRRKRRARIAGRCAHHFLIATIDDHIGEPGGKRRPLGHRQQMLLALLARNLDQHAFVNNG